MKKLFLILSVLALSIFMLSCENNLFQFLRPADSGNFEECMAKGDAAYKSSNYPEAQKWYEKAVALRPNDSDARYCTAKAFMRVHDLDVISLASQILGKDVEEDLVAGLDKDEIMSIYDGTKGAQIHVHHIATGNCLPENGGSGRIRPKDVYWDDAFVTTLQALTLVFKVMESLDELGESFQLIAQSSWVSVSDWDALTLEQQQEIQEDMNNLVDDIEEIIDLIATNEEEKQELIELIDKFRNICG